MRANGVTYKVYKSTEKAEAPDKLLFEVSIDPKESEGRSVQEIAEQFRRFSSDAMARGVLDEIGEQVFTTGKIRKVLDRLFQNPPPNLIRIIRSLLDDESVKPVQVKEAIKRLWTPSSEIEIGQVCTVTESFAEPKVRHRRGTDYDEGHHTKGKPHEAIELYRTLDKFCRELDPTGVQRKYLAKYVRYTRDKHIFCCVHLQKSGLRVWLKLDCSHLESPPDYVRDVSGIGHWGVGDVEIGVDDLDKLEATKSLVRQSFEENK